MPPCDLLHFILDGEMSYSTFFILLKINLRQSRAMIHLEAVFPSPPARVLFRRHVYDRHDVSHLRRGGTDGQSKVKTHSESSGDQIQRVGGLTSKVNSSVAWAV